MAEELEAAAADLEKTQWEMVVFGLMVAYQIMTLVAGGPAGMAAGKTVLAAGRTRFLSMLKGLVSRLASGRAPMTVIRSGRVPMALIRRTAVYAGLPAGVDALAQGVQIAQGHRRGWDTKSVLFMGLAGAGGGLGGELIARKTHGLLSGMASQRLRHAAVQMSGGVGGVLGGTASMGLVTGQFSLTRASLINGLAMGLVGAGKGVRADDSPLAGLGGEDIVRAPSSDPWDIDTAAFIDGNPQTYHEFRQTMLNLAERHPARTSWRVIGHTRGGLPMEMLSIHGGPTNILLINDPHPMEPVGRTTTHALAEAAMADPRLLADASYHIIISSDPDSSVLNNRWPATEGPVDMAAFNLGIHRGAMSGQPDHNFPTPWQPESPLPETRAQMRIMGEFDPVITFSLHNTDFEGAYVFVGHNHARPATEIVSTMSDILHTAATQRGIPVAETTPDAEGMPTVGRGVFEVPPLPDVPSSSRTAAHGAWSLQYGARHGVAAAVEVPIWNYRPSSLRRGEAVDLLNEALTVFDDISSRIPPHIQPTTFSESADFSVHIVRETTTRWADPALPFNDPETVHRQSLRLGGALLRHIDETLPAHAGDSHTTRQLIELRDTLYHHYSRWARNCENDMAPTWLSLRDSAGVQLEIILQLTRVSISAPR
ncbi:hypothetical protein ACIBEK_07385 [Nocardia fusca]|uniref:hypothetical protein n=1 Tax=Nocardia fusca TaxID=941183 RepID=UPI003792A0EF